MTIAVVPMKPLSVAKKRLAGILPQAELSALVCAMLCDVLTALNGASHVTQTFVATSDPALASLAASHGAGHIVEDAPKGLNCVVTAAAGHLETMKAGAMLLLPGDVPLVSAAEIDALVSCCARQNIGIVPAHDDDGTNALLLSPPGTLAPSFGPGSFKRHTAAGRTAGLDPVIMRFGGLGRDIDTPADLQFLLARMAGRPEYDRLRIAAARDFAGVAQATDQHA